MTLEISRSRYQELKSIAADVIEDYSLAYPIDPFELADRLGAEIYVSKYGLPYAATELSTDDGFTEVTKSRFSYSFKVVINGSKPRLRQRFTAAHECSHILLDHLIGGLPLSGDAMEQEANFFAGYLLAPDVLIHHWTPTGHISEIAAVFDLSSEAAVHIYRRYAKARNLGAINQAHDRQIYSSASRRRAEVANQKLLLREA